MNPVDPSPQSDQPADGAPLGKRQKQRDKTQAKLLDVALQQFATKGFEGTAIRDIAEAADVNHGMIRYYFKNKDNLWRAAVTLLFERMERELSGPFKEDRNVDELTKTKNRIRRYVKYCARHPEHARIMIQESIRDNSRLAWAVEKFIRPQHENARGLRSRKGSEGIWPEISDASLAYIFVACCQLPFVLAPEIRHLYGIDILHEAQVEAHADAVVTFLFDHKASELRS